MYPSPRGAWPAVGHLYSARGGLRVIARRGFAIHGLRKTRWTGNTWRPVRAGGLLVRPRCSRRSGFTVTTAGLLRPTQTAGKRSEGRKVVEYHGAYDRASTGRVGSTAGILAASEQVFGKVCESGGGGGSLRTQRRSHCDETNCATNCGHSNAVRCRYCDGCGETLDGI